MNVHDGAESINLCIVEEEQFQMVYIIDLDGTLSPEFNSTKGPSTLLASDNDELMKFVDIAKCRAVPEGCYNYCKDTCFRSVLYVVDGEVQQNYMLKICPRDNHSQCSLFPGGRRGDTGPHEFTAHLPDGRFYDAVFVDTAGQAVTPTTVTGSYDEPYCSRGKFEVTLLENW
jgi:hypothetical protein